MKKKLLSVLLALTMLMSLLVVPANATVLEGTAKLRIVPDVTSTSIESTGSAIDVVYYVYITPDTSASQTIGAIGFDFSVPAGMTLSNVELDSYDNGDQGGDGYWVNAMGLAAGGLTTSEYQPSNARFGAYGGKPTKNVSTEKLLMTIKATIAADQLGDFTLSATNIGVTHYNGTDTYTCTPETTTINVYEELSSASVTVTAPTKGSGFTTTATSGDSSKYTAGAVSWYTNAACTSAAPATALADKDYYAKVVLTPKTSEGVTFASSVNVTVNETAADSVTKETDGTLTVVKKFHTAAKALSSISVSGATTSYTVDDYFSTTGMTVTAHYDDTTSASVTGYTLSPDTSTRLKTNNTKVTVSYTEGGVTKTADVNITVSTKSLSGADITLGDALTYNKNEQTQTVSSVELDGVTLAEGTDYTVSNNTGTNAGNGYELTITGTGTNYTGTATKSFSIAKAKVTKPTTGENTFTYNKTEQTYTPANFDDDTMSISNNAKTNADTYNATVSLKDTTNYEWSTGGVASFNMPFTINKAEVDVTAFPWENTYTFDYDDTNKTVALATYSDLVNAPAYENNVEKYVGTYEASAKFTLKDTANYKFKNDVDTTTQSWSILPVAQPATLSKNVATVTINKTVSIAGLINDLSEGATVQYAVTSGGGSVNNSGIYTAPGTAGTATVSVNVLAHNVDGKGDAEYTAKDLGTVTITVNTKHVDTTTMSVTMADYTYGDSTTPDPNPTGKPASTTDLEYLYTGTKTIGGSYSSDKKPTDAGSYAVKVSCEDDENVYEATANFTVASKSLSAATVDAIDDQTYTGSVIEPTVTVKDGTTTLTLDTDYTVAYATNHTNVADSPVAVTITGKGNYTGSPSAAVSFNIIKAQLTKPTLTTNTDLTYTGKEQTRPNPSGFDSNTMTITGNTGTNAGDYTAVISLKDSDNYEWADGTTAALNAPFTIAKLAKALPTAGTNSFVYNGKDQTYAPAGYDSTLMKFKVTDSETKKNVGDYSVVVELKDTDNYKWAGDAADPTLEFHITAKELTFTASGSRDYDGTTVVSPTTLMTVTLSGMVNNESVAAPAVTSVGNTSKADAGTYDVTVTVGALSDGNYTLKSNTISNGQFTINPIPAGSAPVAEDAGVTVTENKAPVEDTSKKTTTYDLKVQNDGSSDTATVVLAYPTGMTKADAAKYNFVLKDASGNTVTFSGAMAAGLAFELPASAGGTSGEYTLTWTAKSSSSGKFLGEPGTSTGTTSSGGDMNVPTTLTGINKVTVDGKTVPSKYYTVSGSTVVLSEEYMKTLSNGKHVIKAENATHVYTVSINVNNAAVKSAGTGDVGIALYAMLALSSATGAVWVSRKKKED